MLREARHFPWADIAPADEEFIIELCGGEPVNNPEYVKRFLNTSGQPMLYASRLVITMASAAIGSSTTLEIDPIAGGHAFRKGALFYTGLLTEVSPLVELPCEDSVLSDVGNQDNYAFTWLAMDRLHDETPRVYELLGRLREGLGHEHDNLHNVALMGAGYVHIVVADSLKSHEEIALLEAEHPELADLEDIFKELP